MDFGKVQMREKFFKYWKLLRPIRLYLSHFPYPRGKGLLLRYLVTPLLPPKGTEYLLMFRAVDQFGLAIARP